MKRTNKGRLRWIASLMALTQVLLLLFLVKWLDAQYKEQKLTLQEKLEFTYKDAFDNVLEANIAKRIDSFSLNIGDTTRPGSIEYRVVNGATVLIRRDSNEHFPPEEKMDSFSNTLKKTMAFFMKSVMIEAKKEGDTATFITEQDSSQVKAIFQDKLRRENIRVKIAWTGDKDNLRIDLEDPSPWSLAYISDYNPFLLQKITPQIGFSLLLFLLCGFAFLLSYRTLRRQYLLNLQKNDFINNMSHELKTPVATAKVAIEALQKFDAADDPTKRKDYLEMAAWEMDRLDRLVTNVMNNVQMESGTIRMLQQPADLDALLKNLSDNMRPLFAEKQKTLTYRSDVKGTAVSLDAVHFQGAVYNILDNALKYGGNNVIICLGLQEGRITVSISDDGAGIPEEYRQKIFERFFRIPSGNVHNVKGYGLGLNYVHYVIEAHGGSIVQANNNEGGATFTITLPATS